MVMEPAAWAQMTAIWDMVVATLIDWMGGFVEQLTALLILFFIVQFAENLTEIFYDHYDGFH